jgi:hypothetical protein
LADGEALELKGGGAHKWMREKSLARTDSHQLEPGLEN